jgi:hypothetical protein
LQKFSGNATFRFLFGKATSSGLRDAGREPPPAVLRPEVVGPRPAPRAQRFSVHQKTNRMRPSAGHRNHRVSNRLTYNAQTVKAEFGHDPPFSRDACYGNSSLIVDVEYDNDELLLPAIACSSAIHSDPN